jgi:hypothetical protein
MTEKPGEVVSFYTGIWELLGSNLRVEPKIRHRIKMRGNLPSEFFHGVVLSHRDLGL